MLGDVLINEDNIDESLDPLAACFVSVKLLASRFLTSELALISSTNSRLCPEANVERMILPA